MTQTFNDVADDCTQWFKAQYAPLWASAEGLDPAKVQAAYASSFQEYTLDGDVIMHENSIAGWENRFAMYKAGGWAGAELSRIDAYASNPKHVLVEVCWKHFGEDGSSGIGGNT